MLDSVESSEPNGSTTKIRTPTSFLFFQSVCGGTLRAGGAFGFAFGLVEGGLVTYPVATLVITVFTTIFGFLIAGAVGAPIIAAVTTACWCLRLSRFSGAVGSLAGGLTGIIATGLLVSWAIPSGFRIWLALAGLFGMVGGERGERSYRSGNQAEGELDQATRKPLWRFTLSDLFIRIAVISVLLAVYVLVVDSVEASRRYVNQPANP